MISPLERDMLVVEYNGHVDLAKHSRVQSIRESSDRRAREIAEKLGWIKESN